MIDAATGTLLGFDFGLKRIGVALGSREVRVATPLETIDCEDNRTRFSKIADLIARWSPNELIVGLPTHLDGAEHEMTARARRFARQLKGRFGLPVVLVDERLTSLAAEELLREAKSRRRGNKGDVDALAAQIIVQSYLDDLASVIEQEEKPILPDDFPCEGEKATLS